MQKTFLDSQTQTAIAFPLALEGKQHKHIFHIHTQTALDSTLKMRT